MEKVIIRLFFLSILFVININSSQRKRIVIENAQDLKQILEARQRYRQDTEINGKNKTNQVGQNLVAEDQHATNDKEIKAKA